jgi:UDP:flavonoid glycosyltransferase YjiC (YdhE family)
MIGVRSDPTEPPKFETERNKLLNTAQPASAMSIGQRCFMTLKSCNMLAMRSCLEWEPESVPLVAKLHGKPVVPLGLMPPSHRGLESNDASLAWLDNQPTSSVVYVALGSEVPLPVAHVHELALGLELAGTRFLWALRKPSTMPEANILPPGFEGRTRHLGVVTTGWVPQTSVLAHGAVAAFLTHCGWNSIIEGLLFGRPLIMLPIYGDQGPNARMMEKRNVGVQVPRDENDGSFHRQGVATAVSSVMAENGMLAANAKKLQEIVSDSKCHERYIDGLIQQLTCYNADTE